ncbi:hypothetical protein [Acinetobacter nematophilus]|uniref:Uncharacterized protein n=1 Tax=Acinetobacter nematophilus TaxID=2994642 RepID=A0A9X3IJ03_9GAMM|nr:hypothetical protein [Acinetobacter nematophilus]MCX5469761.1 hypothetical protein [Acinetobacter nematophilus]
MLKKILIVLSLLISPIFTYAASCFELNLRAYQKEQEINSRWQLVAQSKHRIYFHSAPKKLCKMDDTFVIQNDHVTAYSVYIDQAKQKWVYVVFNDPNQHIEDDLVEGWVKLKDFKSLQKTAITD